jgi:hypothetical protein
MRVLLIVLYSVQFLAEHPSILLNLVHSLVQDITPHGILHTLNHIITRMPQISMLEDENPARLGQNVVPVLHIVRVKGSRASLELVVSRG